MRQGALIFLVFCWAGAALAYPMNGARPVAEIPYRIDYEGWVTIDITVNGKGPYAFIIDSGATITAVFENLAVEQTFSPADRPPIRVLGLAAAKNLPAYFIGDINIGGRTLTDQIGVILPDWAPPRQPPQGVVGLDFLTQYTVLIDADARVIRLYDKARAPDGRGRGWSSTAMVADDFRQDGGALYRIATNMQGRRIPCIIDLGASGTLLNYSALRQLLSGVYFNESKDTGFSTGSRLHDIFDNTKVARLVHVRRISIASARWRNQLFTVFDAPIFEELGVSRKPFCLVGSDLMLTRSFIFDFARERLYIGPKSRRSAADTR